MKEVAAAMSAGPHVLGACLKRRFSRIWCPHNSEEIFVGGIKEDTGEHHLRDYLVWETEVIEVTTD